MNENNHSKVPAILSAALSVIIICIIYLLFKSSLPTENKDVILVILGAVVKEWGSAMQYWFGTTRSSANKDLKLKQNKE